jgi:putative Holliday junction resolvase
MKEKRFLGLDFGQRRIGVAISDPSGLIAGSLKTLIVKNTDDALQQVLDLVSKHNIAGIVLGLPLNLSGDASEVSKEVEAFAERIRSSYDMPVFLEDERLSSRLAESVLHAHGKRIKGRKEKIDRISAVIILQSFLDRRNISQAREQD